MPQCRRRLMLRLEALEDRLTPSTLIPIADRRDLIVDATRNLLYITTMSGNVERFDPTSQTLLTPLKVGNTLTGGDITPDGSALYLAELQFGTTGVIHKVSLITGAETDIPFALGPLEGGSWDVKIGANGIGFVTTVFQGSGSIPLRQLDTRMDTLTVRDHHDSSAVAQNTVMFRGGDRSLLFFMEGSYSGAPIFTYNSATDSFPTPIVSLGTPNPTTVTSAVSPDGSMIAMETSAGVTILDAQLNLIQNLPLGDAGVAFDPSAGILYAASSTTGLITAYDTHTWLAKYEMPIGESMNGISAFGPGKMTTSGDGKELFLSTPSGVREYLLPTATGGAVSLSMTGFPSSILAGLAGSFTVTVYDPAGHVAGGYQGTVHFSSSDGTANLPADYTFTSADSGVHTFSAFLTKVGVQTLTTRDMGNANLLGTETVMVKPGSAIQFAIMAPATSVAGAAFSMTVMALDAFGNQATAYMGTIGFASSDVGSPLPGHYTFQPLDQGMHTFSSAVTFLQSGMQMITATDLADGTIAGQVSIQVSPALTQGLSVTDFPLSASAGVAAMFTVSARDAYGNVTPGFTGTIHLSSSDPQANLPGDYTFVLADQGTHRFAGTLKTAGMQTISASFGSAAAAEQVTVLPAAAAGYHLVLPTGVTAGAKFSISVTAVDAFGNTANDYAGTVHFGSSDHQAGLPLDYTFTAVDAGIHVFSNAFFLGSAGNQQVSVSDSGNNNLTVSGSVAVGPAIASHLGLGLAAPVSAGSAVSLTVTAYDQFGNMATGYVGTVHFSSSDGLAILPVNYTFTGIDAGIHTFVNGATFSSAGDQTLAATDTINSGVKGSLTVIISAAPVTHFAVALATASAAGSALTVTVTAEDAFQNVVNGYAGTIHFGSGDGSASLPGDFTFTGNEGGGHTFVLGVILEKSGDQVVTVVDTVNNAVAGAANVTVAPGATSQLGILIPQAGIAGAPFNLTVAAQDAFGNTTPGYTGTIHFASSDRTAVEPADYSFASSDHGVHVFVGGAIMDLAGSEIITAVDRSNASISGIATITIHGSNAARFRIVATAGSVAGSAIPVVVTAIDAFGNIADGYVGTVHFSSSDIGATVPADYAFTIQDAGTHTFTTGFVLRRSGGQTIIATDLATAISGTGLVFVNAASASHLIVGGPSQNSLLTPFAVTVQALDAFNNQVVGYAGTVHFTSSDSLASLPRDFTFASGNGGQATFPGITLRTVGIQTITVQDMTGAVSEGTTAIAVIKGSYLATGADAGGGPEVRVFDALTGTVKMDFYAYDPRFLGGVRVAVGDVTGDGIPDIITAPGPGGGPDVRVFDGVTGIKIREFMAYDPRFVGGVYVAVGDVNGDGHADIITGVGPGGGPHVEVFSGRDNALLWSFMAYDPVFKGGVRTAAGDVNGDGRADIVTAPGPGGGPDIRVFSGVTGSKIQEFFAYDATFSGGVYVTAGDINGDGRADIITGEGAGGAPIVKVFNGVDDSVLRSFLAFDPVFLGGVRVAYLANESGTGPGDIVTAAGPGGGPLVQVLEGATLAAIDSLFAYDPRFLGGVFIGGE